MALFLFMTTSASLLICITLLLRPLTGRVFPRVTQMILWIAAALRLLLPVRFHSPIGVFERTYVQPQNISVPTYSATPTEPSAVPHATVTTEIITVPTVAEPTVSAPTTSPEDILFWVWLAGAVVLFSVILFLHIRNLFWCKEKTRDRNAECIVPCSCTVYRCTNVKSPFVYGMLRPRIVLPVGVSGDDLLAVLAHEAAHIRRMDIFKKYLFAAALCVQWFNPLVWLMVYFSAQDMEILCDAHALLMPGAPNVKAYAQALLNAEERRTVFNLGFKSNTEVRIMKILKKDKHNRLLMLVSVLLAVLLVTACTTATKSPDDSTNTNSLSVEEPLEHLRLNEEKTASNKDFFIKNGTYGFGGLQIGMPWEEAKTYVTQLSGEKDPVLTDSEQEHMPFCTFPYSLYEYNGVVTVYFLENKIQDIFFTCSLDSNAAVEFAHYTISEKLQKQLGAPDDRRNVLFESWNSNTVSLVLFVLPMEETDDEKNAVRIQITRRFSDDQEEPTSSYAEAHTENRTDASSEIPYSEPTVGFTIQSEEDAYIALEYIDVKISQLEQERLLMEQERLLISKVLTRWEQEDEEYLAYRHAALDILGEDADEHDIRVQIAWLKAEDALGFISRSLPDTEGKECMKISIKREDTDEVLSSHIVPKDEYMQYLKEFRIETAEADVYVSFTSVD